MSPKDKPSLLDQVRGILKDRGYEKTCLPLEDVANRVERTYRNVDTKIWLYKWASMVLLVLIPFLSTSLSLFAAYKKPVTGSIISLSVALTILTLLNSIFRPSLRFRELCEMGIAIQDLRDDFLTELEDLKHGVEESSLHAIREAFHKQLVPHERRLIALFLPSEPALQAAPRGRLATVKESAKAAAAGAGRP